LQSRVGTQTKAAETATTALVAVSKAQMALSARWQAVVVAAGSAAGVKGGRLATRSQSLPPPPPPHAKEGSG
jgi:hypothetical protein